VWRVERVRELEPWACWHSEDSLSSPGSRFYGELRWQATGAEALCR
jgi:hypothetical protein